MTAFCEELANLNVGPVLRKLAYGPEAMGKVLKAFKRNAMKADIRLWGEAGPSMGYGYVPTEKGMLQGVRDMLAEAGMPAQDARQYIKDQGGALAELFDIGKRRGPTFLQPRKKDSVEFYRHMNETTGIMDEAALNDVAGSPSNRRALDALTKGHELAESQVTPTVSFRGLGHLSPDVILREHNMVRTLPPENEAAGRVMKGMRRLAEGPLIEEATDGAFRYGESPRLSRHARKHVTKMVEDYRIKLRDEMGSSAP